MNEVITAAGALPTAIFTGLLIAALFYWLMVILGAFHFGLGHGHEGAGHAVGHAEPGGPDAGGHLHGGHEGGADAHAGHGHGHSDAAHGHGTGHGEGEGHGLLEFLSIGQVPLSITLSAVVFIAWIASMVAELALHHLVAGIVPGFVFGSLQGGASLVAGLVAGGYLVRPLRPLFLADGEHAQESLEGRMVRITSGTVDERHGTAVYEVAGPDVLLNVVCRAGHALVRGEHAVVVEYDREREVYLVAPLPHMREADASAKAAAPPPDPPAAPAIAVEPPLGEAKKPIQRPRAPEGHA